MTTTKKRAKRKSAPRGKRKKAEPSKVITAYVHGTPTELAAIERQFYLAHRYRDKLAEIEISRRRILNRVAGSSCIYSSNKLDEAQKAVTEAEERMRDANSEAGCRVDSTEERRELRRLKARMDRWEYIHRQVRKRAYATPAVRARSIKVDRAVKALSWTWLEHYRHVEGLFWGTYNQVNQAMSRCRKGPPPVRRKQDSRGKIAIQTQRGLDTAMAFLPKHEHQLNILIDPIPAEAWQTGKEPGALPLGERLRLRRTRVRMRVRNNPNVWTQLNVFMHRQLPLDAKIQWVFLMRKRVGFRWIWGLRFVVSRATGFQDPLCATSGKVGVDLGWRVMPDGLRVAVWHGTDGESGELQLPAEVYTAWDKADQLQADSARLFNEMVAELKVWLAGRTIPDWLARSTETLSHWKSARRLQALQYRWKTLRWRMPPHLLEVVPPHRQFREGDAVYELLDPVPDSQEIQEKLRAWYRKDRRLHDWRMFQMRKAANKREEIFYRFAAILRRKYETVRVEGINWRELMRRPELEDEPEDGKPATRKYAREGSPGLLREILERTFAKSDRVAAAYTTRPCFECGHCEKWDQSQLRHMCGSCLSTWDQDYNAAKHILNAPPLPKKKKGDDEDADE